MEAGAVGGRDAGARLLSCVLLGQAARGLGVARSAPLMPRPQPLAAERPPERGSTCPRAGRPGASLPITLHPLLVPVGPLIPGLRRWVDGAPGYPGFCCLGLHTTHISPFPHEGYIRLCNKMVTSGRGMGRALRGWVTPSQVSQNVLQQILESSVHNSVSLPQVTLSPRLYKNIHPQPQLPTQGAAVAAPALPPNK